MNRAPFVVLIGAWVLSCTAGPTPPAHGTWVFSKTVDFEDPTAAQPAPASTNITFDGEVLNLSPTCSVRLRKETCHPGGPFQALLKAEESEASIARFAMQQFKFDLRALSGYYRVAAPNACNTLGDDVLISGQTLIAVRAGLFFSGFTRASSASSPAAPAGIGVDLQGLKTSQLPFRVAHYMARCAANLPTVKGVPQATSKCAPAYHPYVASRQSRDAIGKLVGSHGYQKGGARNDSEDYNNPVANGLHPVYPVFPPMGEVVLVRVDDLERAEDRDVIKGVYLAIKNGQVTDQLNAGCSFDSRYVCGSEGQAVRYQLTESGKFKRME